MNRKVILASIIFLIVCLFSSICLANTKNVMDDAKNTTVNLKDEITNSIDKTENNTRNVTQNIMTPGQTGNTIRNNNNNDNNDNNNNNNGYNTTRTAVNDQYFAGTGMNTATWLWIILAIAAIIIIAAVWYYAMQGNHIDNDK